MTSEVNSFLYLGTKQIRSFIVHSGLKGLLVGELDCSWVVFVYSEESTICLKLDESAYREGSCPPCMLLCC
ncbi:hypothetical protein D9M68_18710 [compost metagenome]